MKQMSINRENNKRIAKEYSLALYTDAFYNGGFTLY